MLALSLILILAALALLLAFKSNVFGGKKKEGERRHPGQPFEDEDGILKRRKDDNVGGEGG